jgi:hypothetical protein
LLLESFHPPSDRAFNPQNPKDQHLLGFEALLLQLSQNMDALMDETFGIMPSTKTWLEGFINGCFSNPLPCFLLLSKKLTQSQISKGFLQVFILGD